MNAIVTKLLEMGVPMLILSLAFPFLTFFISYYFICKLLPNRLNIYLLISTSLVYTLWFVLRDSELLGTRYHLAMSIFANAWTLLMLVCFIKGRFWKKLIVWWYFDIIKTMCQAAAYVPILLYHSRHGVTVEWEQVLSSVESGIALNLAHMTAFISLFLLLGFLSLTIWRRILMRKFHLFYLLFIILPMGQSFSIANVIHPNMGNPMFGILINFVSDVATVYNILSVLGISLSLVASAAILYYILSQDKRTAIEAQITETKRALELEQARYSAMKERSEELAKIRHDFNNQLASIIQLVRVGEDDTAEEIISALTNEINGARDN